MLLDMIITTVGIVILLVGGELLVKGASSLARDLGVSPLAVGLTVVAFGTSAPELAVSVNAAVSGAAPIAFGNIFGSNMANVGLILGVSAVMRPLPIDYIIVRRELPMMLLSLAAAAVMSADLLLNDRPDVFDQGDGVLLLLFFIIFLYYTAGDLIREREVGEARTSRLIHLEGIDQSKRPMRDLALSIAGMVGLILGASLTIEGGVAIAEALGVPEVVIGLTVVSVGTSLPELVACLTAVRHGESEIAVGGIVGSNIFNTLLVCGVTAVIRPLPIPPLGHLDLAATSVLSLVLLFTARTHDRRIIRYEGATLLVLYLSYISWRTMVTNGVG
jgi:cation:H+ antiporter